MEASQRSDELEEECRKLEQEKYKVEKDLLATRDMANKLDMRRGQAESEVARLSAALQKVLVDCVTPSFRWDSSVQIGVLKSMGHTPAQGHKRLLTGCHFFTNK